MRRGAFRTYLGGVDLAGLVVLDLVGRARQDAPALNNVDAKADQARLQVPLDAVGQVLGVGGDPLPRKAHFSLHFNSQ